MIREAVAAALDTLEGLGQREVFSGYGVEGEDLEPIYHHTPADVAEAVHQLVTGQVPVERLITARLPLSELRRALQMVADRTTLRTILVPDP